MIVSLRHIKLFFLFFENIFIIDPDKKNKVYPINTLYLIGYKPHLTELFRHHVFENKSQIIIKINIAKKYFFERKSNR